MSNTAIQKSVQFYMFLLKFYPKSYQQEFAEEMRFVFQETLKETVAEKGTSGLWNFWLRTISDFCHSVITQHQELSKGKDPMKNQSSGTKPNVMRVVLITGGLLLIPLAGTQLSSEWVWTSFDFLIAGALIMSTGLIYEYVVKKLQTKQSRLIGGLVLLAACALVWIELAVGIFD